MIFSIQVVYFHPEAFLFLPISSIIPIVHDKKIPLFNCPFNFRFLTGY